MATEHDNSSGPQRAKVQGPDARELDLPAETTDAELEALPPPRRPWRGLTLVCMGVTLLLSLLILVSLRHELAFSFRGSEPEPIGELSRFRPSSQHQNHWVHGMGELVPEQAVAYRRPLERDSYRLARVVGSRDLWVQVRVPYDEADPEHVRFVPPTSFVGRLIAADARGLRYTELGSAVAESGIELPSEAWILVDGEAPSTTRWTIGLGLLLLGFAAFNAVGLVQLLRPATD
jgi:hypothetical protein